MNTNKIIFAVLGSIILFLIIMLVLQLNRGTEPRQAEKQGWDFNIWTLDEERASFDRLIADFKDEFTRYANTNIGIETFSDRTLYEQTIISSLWAWNAPDIFLLNNKDTSPLENHVIGISPSVVSPNDFRRDFYPVFSEDLVLNIEKTDFLKWIPVWFQVPALYYNRRNFPRPSELGDWGRLGIEMESMAQRSNIPPLALGVGSGITRNSSTVLSFLTQEWVWDIEEVQNTHTRQVMSQYRALWLIWNQTYIELAWDNPELSDIELFARWDVASILAYPRDIKTIADIWFSSNMLFVSPFPLSEWKRDSVAIDYDYYVIQKNTSNLQLAEDFMSYLASRRWQEMYWELFPHQIPAQPSLAIERAEEKIHPRFNVIQRNFLRDQTELISFWVWNTLVFESTLQEILDSENRFDSRFQLLKSRISCMPVSYTHLTLPTKRIV